MASALTFGTASVAAAGSTTAQAQTESSDDDDSGKSALMVVVAYGFDDLPDPVSWEYITWLGIAYIISRALAKAGSQRQYDRNRNY